MNIFSTLPAGDSAAWSDDPVTLPDGRQASFAGGWALKYFLRGPSSLDLVSGAGSTAADGWSTTLSAAASAVLAAGTYSWVAVITKATERITVGSGQLVLQPDLSQAAAGYDGRSAAQRALAACEAAMATFNTTGGKVKKYEIAGRTMEFQTIAELMALHSFWKAKVMSEASQQSIANGLGNPRNLHVRFRRP